ncbi:MAG TPA: hypothetical protein VFW04_02220 [Gemmatimonadaceae bacterium]|nr:hypothetical protein [Gemmatimonadaceae bacterium]
MTKPPAFQWYPGDFRRDTALMACSFEARALWREMLDLMHDGTPRGHLTAGGVPITTERLAHMVGVSRQKARRWLAELEERHVFSRTEAGVIYSRRMVRDERVRTVRAAGGKDSLKNPNVPRPKRQQGQVEGHPSNHPSEVSSPPSFGGSPAVAVASASSLQLQKPLPRKHRAGSNGGPPETWLTPAHDAWEVHFGAGSFDARRAAKCLSPIYRAGIDPSEIGRRLARYCTRKKSSNYCKIEDFAQRHGDYAVPSGPLVDADGVLTELGDRETRPARVQT